MLTLILKYWKYLAVILLVVGVYEYVNISAYHDGYDKANAEWQVKWDRARDQAQKDLIAAKDEQKKEDDARIKVKDEAIAKYTKTISNLNSRIASLNAEHDSLRDNIAAVTDSDSKAVSDLASCRATAKTLGVLLGQADTRAERDARELEETSASVRVLLDAWPK